MSVSIVFDKSGDSIEFKLINHSVAEYYVDQLNSSNSNAFFLENSSDISTSIASLMQSIDFSNKNILEFLNFNFKLEDDECYLSQNVLNQLHADWVNIQKKKINLDEYLKKSTIDQKDIAEKLFHSYPDNSIVLIGALIEKLDLFHEFNKINLCIHALERNLSYQSYRTKKRVEFLNIFPKEIITNDSYQLSVPCQHLGRPLYDKYLFFDDDLVYDDENTINELIGYVVIRLTKSQTIPFSTEYTKWCQAHNKPVSGYYINIGELPDIDRKLNDYRLVLYRNRLDHFSIHLK